MNAWQEILNYLKTKVNTQSYQTWLRPTSFENLAQGVLTVRVPNREFQEWIQEQYGSHIKEAVERTKPGFHEVRYVFEESGEKRTLENGKQKTLQGKLDFESVAHELNERYTFDTFVVGSCNQFAHAAALAVAE